jgi:hypothetical protein
MITAKLETTLHAFALPYQADTAAHPLTLSMSGQYVMSTMFHKPGKTQPPGATPQTWTIAHPLSTPALAPSA